MIQDGGWHMGGEARNPGDVYFIVHHSIICVNHADLLLSYYTCVSHWTQGVGNIKTELVASLPTNAVLVSEFLIDILKAFSGFRICFIRAIYAKVLYI